MIHWEWLLSGLLLVCLASFRWAISNFFSQPAGDNSGMKAIRWCSTVFALLHLGLIFAKPPVTEERAIGGAALYLLALGLFWWAIRTHRNQPLSAAFSPDAPLHLVTRGPYSIIRHPLYTSYLLTWTSGAVATGSIWLVPTVLVMFLLYWQAARTEERKFAHSPLADSYRRYQASTGQFSPDPLKWIATIRKEHNAASLAEYRA